MAKRAKLFNQGWSFVDYQSNEFFWHVSKLSRKWTLSDASGSKVAFLKRESFSRTKIGVLEIYEDNIPEQLLHLILLTCEVTHEEILKTEQGAAAAAASA